MKQHTRKVFFKAFWRLIEVVPVILPAAIAAFGSVAVFFLLLGRFNPWYIWPLGLATGAATSFFIFKNYPRTGLSKVRKICNILVIVGVLLWGGFNIMYTSQHIMVNRDPAIYANAGIWLTKHDNLNIPVTTIFKNPGGVINNNGGAGFPINPKDLTHYQAQGTHILPAFLGLAGRMLGVAKMLHINILFGMSALLAIYGFARYIIKNPWWSVVVTGALAASMPFIYFSRDTYSEPLATTFTFGALSLMWLAIKTKKYPVWFLAGFVTAAAVMTRIDGFLTVAASFAFLTIMLALSKKLERKIAINNSLLFTAGMAITGMIGWLDVTRLSVAYYVFHPQIKQELIAILLIIIIGLLLVWLSWKTNIIKKLNKLTVGWRAEAGLVAVPFFVVLLYTRPFWLYGNYGYVRMGRRSFAEISTQWVSWYIGGALAVLGVVGFAYCLYKVLNKKNLVWIYFMLVVGVTALVYLIKPSVFPDQIWASRRFMPVIIPGVAVFAAVMLDLLSNEFLPKIKAKFGYILVGIVSLVIVFVPLTTSMPLLKARTFTQLGVVNDVCRSLPKNSVVLWLGIPKLTMVQPTKGVCGFEAVGYVLGEKNDKDLRLALTSISKESQKHGLTPVIAGQDSDMSSLPSFISSNTEVIANYQYNYLEHVELGPPQRIKTGVGVFRAGFIMPDGSVKPIELGGTLEK